MTRALNLWIGLGRGLGLLVGLGAAAELLVPFGAIVFLAHLHGVELGASGYATALLATVLISLTVAPVPSASVMTLAPALATLGIPPAGLGLLLAIDRIPDMFRSAMNVWGQIAVSALAGRKSFDAPATGALAADALQRLGQCRQKAAVHGGRLARHVVKADMVVGEDQPPSRRDPKPGSQPVDLAPSQIVEHFGDHDEVEGA